ncbi:YceI family protein [Brevundimonas sp. FT23042]|uniref:YceI family protein n=1 Tax=Brevundimonas sp. FT23042 TaxID=3393749 RepID=UPI003B5873E8
MTGLGRVARSLVGGALWGVLAALAPPPEAWSIDRAGSTIDLSVRSFAGVHTGRFEDWTGDILVDPDAPERSRATVTVRVRSLRMQPGSATERALGPGFLDAARYPVIRFQLRALQPEGGGRYTARADLTARGVTRPVSFPMDLRTEGARAQMTGGFAFDRADFGIGTSGVWNGLIDRQVTVRVALQARRA